MAIAAVNNTQLYYEDSGVGPAVVFSHGLLWSCRMFDAQVERLKKNYRCIAYDHRGQGKSAAAFERSIPIETCYLDAVALIEQLGVGPCHFVGLSMGGFVGMRLGARRPDLIKSLSLLETSADPEPVENLGRYKMLSRVARVLGPWAVAKQVMPVMFGRTFLTDPKRAADREHWRKVLSNNPRAIYRAVSGVIDRPGVYSELARITAPTLVLVGDEDTATVPSKARRIAERIPGARLQVIAAAGHSSCIEQPEIVSDALESFLHDCVGLALQRECDSVGACEKF